MGFTKLQHEEEGSFTSSACVHGACPSTVRCRLNCHVTRCRPPCNQYALFRYRHHSCACAVSHPCSSHRLHRRRVPLRSLAIDKNQVFAVAIFHKRPPVARLEVLPVGSEMHGRARRHPLPPRITVEICLFGSPKTASLHVALRNGV